MLSRTCRFFVAGLLKHFRKGGGGCTALCRPVDGAACCLFEGNASYRSQCWDKGGRNVTGEFKLVRVERSVRLCN